MERWRVKIWQKKKRKTERGRMEKEEGGCLIGRSVWSLAEIACVRGVCEILVVWWSRADHVRTEGGGNSSRVMNQQWTVSVCLLASPPRIIWIKPLNWSHRTPCPTTCWAAGATQYVTLPTDAQSFISPSLRTSTNISLTGAYKSASRLSSLCQNTHSFIALIPTVQVSSRFVFPATMLPG